MIFARWTDTVLTLRSSWSAISLFDLPSTMSCRISSSRGGQARLALALQRGWPRELRREHLFAGRDIPDRRGKFEIDRVFQDVAATRRRRAPGARACLPNAC